MCDQHIGAEIGMLGNLLKRQMVCHSGRAEPDHATGMQAMIIHYLSGAQEDRFQRDIETQFRFRRSTATGILQLMERRGLLVREPVPYDARLKRLVLTDKARALHQQIHEKLSRTEQVMREGIDEQDLAVWFRVTDQIRANLENYQRKASEGQA